MTFNHSFPLPHEINTIAPLETPTIGLLLENPSDAHGWRHKTPACRSGEN